MTETKSNKKKSGGFFSGSLLLISSLLIALVLWYMGTLQDQTPVSKSYANIPVEFINSNALESLSLTAEELSDTVTVSVVLKGYMSDISAINEDELVAQIDLAEQDSAGTFKVVPKISGCSPKIETTKIDTVDIKIEKLIKKQLLIEIATTGIPAEGYAVDPANIIYNKELEVICGESISRKVAGAKIVADVTDRKGTFTVNLNIMLVDSRGKALSEADTSKIDLQFYSTNVTVPVISVE